jgi:hypothetical protein
VAPRWMRAGWAEASWVGKIPKELRRMRSFPRVLAGHRVGRSHSRYRESQVKT